MEETRVIATGSAVECYCHREGGWGSRSQVGRAGRRPRGREFELVGRVRVTTWCAFYDDCTFWRRRL
eukprot:1180120-Prorocentrum_minimum.AAC.3